MTTQFKWAKLLGTSGLRAEAPGNVTLYVAQYLRAASLARSLRRLAWLNVRGAEARALRALRFMYRGTL